MGRRRKPRQWNTAAAERALRRNRQEIDATHRGTPAGRRSTYKISRSPRK